MDIKEKTNVLREKNNNIQDLEQIEDELDLQLGENIDWQTKPLHKLHANLLNPVNLYS